jgi:protein-disulfide isomerase
LTVPVSPENDHVQGGEDAPLTLVEYGDYECPYCGAAYPVIKEIQKQMVDDLRFIFRNFPITTSHPHAEQAAEAAEAASAQSHFWEMHDQLFEHQDQLRLEHLRAYARTLHLDLKQFDYELADNVHAQKVRDDFMGGVRSGVNGTPTFFINGVRYDGRHDVNSLLAALRTAAAQA